MANLNEDVLCHIFDYLPTPLEWIQVSRVCKLWKQAASKQWRRIREINYLSTDLEKKLKPGDADNAPLITAEDCDSIVYYAAPFVKTLIGHLKTDKIESLVIFGPFLYKVTNFEDVNILKLLESKATGINEIHFDHQPNLEKLFSNNKIKKVTIEESLDFYAYTSTDVIEELTIGLHSVYYISSFEGKLRNLKKLNLKLNFFRDPDDPQKQFSKFLLHIPRVTSLSLHFKGKYTRAMSCKAFMDIAKLSQLEHLTINNDFTFSMEAANFFLTKLVKGCPKLRSVELIEIRISGNQLRTLLCLPLLEKLTAHRVSNFESLMELPEMPNMRELNMIYNVEKCDLTTFRNVLQKMPNLWYLKLEGDCLALSKNYKFIYRNERFKLLSQIATVAASQNKDMVVEDSDRHGNCKNSVKVKILRRNVGLDAESRKLIIQISFALEDDLVKRLQSFVREKLENYYILVVDGAED